MNFYQQCNKYFSNRNKTSCYIDLFYSESNYLAKIVYSVVWIHKFIAPISISHFWKLVLNNSGDCLRFYCLVWFLNSFTYLCCFPNYSRNTASEFIIMNLDSRSYCYISNIQDLTQRSSSKYTSCHKLNQIINISLLIGIFWEVFLEELYGIYCILFQYDTLGEETGYS